MAIVCLPSVILLATVANSHDNQSTAAGFGAVMYGFMLAVIMGLFGVAYLITRKVILKNMAYACFFGILLLIALPYIFSPFFKS